MNSHFWMIPALPLFGAIINGFFGGFFEKRQGRIFVSTLGIGTVLGSLALCTQAFAASRLAPGMRLEMNFAQWIQAGDLQVPFGMTFDALSCTMGLAVSGISALIHLYSVGYMWEDKGFARYFAYLNLFVFFMLTLVFANSLPLLFVGWEGVGLCSYLLIGYFFDNQEAPDAGLKAFLTNRVGDMGMMAGMLMLFAHFGTFMIADIAGAASKMPPEMGFGIITLATLSLFMGATGKSAQIPLYIWLPDAMAGPTPVSALIHAATMVTSGIYLLCRLAPLFRIAPITLDAVAWVGALTALLAATIGLLQRDIKKVLAYSTVSQLGYMFLAIGCTGFAAGFFHLFTHAWFKALLFLGAGSVIHALHEQDLFRMGGLKKKMPITALTMFLATLCIIGFPFTSGFASKDEILYLAFQKSPLLWVIGVLGACCTAFYMLRLYTLTFLGSPRDEKAFLHAHESPATMTLPLAALALGALLAVFLGWPEAFGGSYHIGQLLSPVLEPLGQAAPHESHPNTALLLALASTALSLGAAWLGYKTYSKGLELATTRAERWPRLHRLILNKYFVDEGLEKFVLLPFRWLGNLAWKLFDVIIIDGIGINVPAAITRLCGDFSAFLQTGRVRNYALSMALGAGALLYIFFK